MDQQQRLSDDVEGTPRLHRARRTRIGARLADVAPPSIAHAVRSAIEYGDQPRSVRQLASALGVRRKTLDRRLAKAGPLTARQLLTWGRLISAAMVLEQPGVTVPMVADSLHFPSPSALRNQLQRYAGVTPTELRRQGGVELLVGKVIESISEPSSLE